MDRGYDGLKVFGHSNRIENLSYLIRIRSGMTKEIKALPDKEQTYSQLDEELNRLQATFASQIRGAFFFYLAHQL